jgi:hypothetical protein
MTDTILRIWLLQNDSTKHNKDDSEKTCTTSFLAIILIVLCIIILQYLDIGTEEVYSKHCFKIVLNNLKVVRTTFIKFFQEYEKLRIVVKFCYAITLVLWDCFCRQLWLQLRLFLELERQMLQMTGNIPTERFTYTNHIFIERWYHMCNL